MQIAALGVEFVGVDVRGRLVGDELVHPDHRPLAGLDLLVDLVRLVGDQPLQVAVLDGTDHPAVLLEIGHDRDDAFLGGIGQRLDEVGAAQRVGHPGHPGLVGQDLLGAQRQRRGLLTGQRERLVPRRGEHRLHPAQDRGQRLVGHPDQVVLRLRGVQRRAAGHAAEPEHRRLVGLRTVALAHDGGPTAPSGTVFRDLLEEVAVGVEEERDLRRELVDGHPAALDHGVAIGDAVGQGERHLLHRIGAGVAEVRAGDRDRVESRHLGGAELDGVGDQSQRRLGRPDPGAARGVLLEDVVLDGAGQLLPRNTLLLGGRDVKGQQDRRGAVDGEAGADLVQGDAVEKDLGVGQGVHRHPDPADLLAVLGIVGVVPALGGQIQRHRKPGAALVEQVAIAPVRFLRGAETGILTKCPQAAAVAVREVAPGEGELARHGRIAGAVGRSVHRLQRDSRRRLGLVVHRWIPYLQFRRMPIPFWASRVQIW